MCGKDRQLRPDSGLNTTEERLPWAKIVLLEEPIDEMRQTHMQKKQGRVTVRALQAHPSCCTPFTQIQFKLPLGEPVK